MQKLNKSQELVLHQYFETVCIPVANFLTPKVQEFLPGESERPFMPYGAYYLGQEETIAHCSGGYITEEDSLRVEKVLKFAKEKVDRCFDLNHPNSYISSVDQEQSMSQGKLIWANPKANEYPGGLVINGIGSGSSSWMALIDTFVAYLMLRPVYRLVHGEYPSKSDVLNTLCVETVAELKMRNFCFFLWFSDEKFRMSIPDCRDLSVLEGNPYK